LHRGFEAILAMASGAGACEQKEPVWAKARYYFANAASLS
jgi:hypothetical protein